MKPLSMVALGVALFAYTGCSTLRSEEKPVDEQFGTRVEGRDRDGRETIVIAPPEEGRTWATYPAVFESVTIRPEPMNAAGTAVAVEILVKGAFPDACTELHDVTQSRAGNLVDITLAMRRPQGAVCAAVLRPYRFYLLLEGSYAAGAYTLKVNDRPYPFELRPPVS